MSKTIVIGLGNPVRSDDALGLEIVRSLRRHLVEREDIEFQECYDGGLDLMEAMIGYDRAFVVDAIVTGNCPGTVHRLEGQAMALSRNSSTTHDGSFAAALELGRLTGLELPAVIKVWAVEAKDVKNFREELSLEVKRAVPLVVTEIARELRACPTPGALRKERIP